MEAAPGSEKKTQSAGKPVAPEVKLKVIWSVAEIADAVTRPTLVGSSGALFAELSVQNPPKSLGENCSPQKKLPRPRLAAVNWKVTLWEVGTSKRVQVLLSEPLSRLTKDTVSELK